MGAGVVARDRTRVEEGYAVEGRARGERRFKAVGGERFGDGNR